MEAQGGEPRVDLLEVQATYVEADLLEVEVGMEAGADLREDLVVVVEVVATVARVSGQDLGVPWPRH